jgi:uncharacterized membrane protein YfcA
MLLARLPYNRSAACDVDAMVGALKRGVPSAGARGVPASAAAELPLLGLSLAALIGLSLGLLGGGGSILTVPIFVYVLGFGAKESIAMSLAVVGAVSLFGAVGHWRAGNVNGCGWRWSSARSRWRARTSGARLAVFFSGPAQLALFAVVMLVAAFFMFRDRPVVAPAGARRPPLPVARICRGAWSWSRGWPSAC